MKKVFVLIISIFSNNIFALNLSLEKALDIAYKNKPSLKALAYQTKTNKFNQIEKLNGYLPQINLTAGFSTKSHQQGLGGTYTVQGSQLVYSFTGPVELYKIAQQDTEFSQIAEQIHRDLIRNQVEVTFFNSWLLQERIKYIKSLKKSSIEVFALNKKQKELGFLSKDQWLSSKVAFDNDTYKIDSYINAFNNSLADLATVLGIEIKEDINLLWTPSINLKYETLDSYISLASKNRKELIAKDKEIKKSSLEKSFYQKQYLPSLYVNGTLAKVTSSVIKYPKELGVSLNWSFDGLSNQIKSKTADTKRIRLLMEKSDLYQQIRKEVTQAYNNLEISTKNLKSQQTIYEKEDNKYSLENTQYKIGNISKPQLEQAKSNWELAKLNILESNVDLSIKKSYLLFVCGYPGNKNEF